MKILIKTITLLFLATSAYAHEGFYAGISAQKNDIKFSNKTLNISTGPYEVKANDYYDNSALSYGLNVGYDYSNKLAFELGWNKISLSKANNNTGLQYTSGSMSGQAIKTNSSLDLNIVSLDVIPSLPLNKSFSLYGSAGLAYVNAKAKESYNNGDVLNDSGNKLGISAGLGVKYTLDKVSLTAGYKHTVLNQKLENVNGFKSIKSIDTFKIGINYLF